MVGGGLVLILVVMDNGLVHCFYLFFCSVCMCLNPCCNGQWSRTDKVEYLYWQASKVLILVVMDNGLVPDLIRLY